jgi:hypothetical protein
MQRHYLLEGREMSFEEFWTKLFGNYAVAFIRNREGKTIPIRLGDRHIAEFFWRQGFNAAVGEVKTSDE